MGSVSLFLGFAAACLAVDLLVYDEDAEHHCSFKSRFCGKFLLQVQDFSPFCPKTLGLNLTAVASPRVPSPNQIYRHRHHGRDLRGFQFQYLLPRHEL